MSQRLLTKTRAFISGAHALNASHHLIKLLIDINESIDELFVIKEIQVGQFDELLLGFQQAAIFLYMRTANEQHRIRGNIIASVASLVFVTESKLILLINDDEWCDLDHFYREKSQFFFKDDFFQPDTFELHHLTFLNKHPLVQFSASNC